MKLILPTLTRICCLRGISKRDTYVWSGRTILTQWALQHARALCTRQPSTSAERPEMREKIKCVDMSFMDPSRTVFRNKSINELTRAVVVFWLCSSRFLVNKNQKLLELSRRILGRYLHKKLMSLTFYGQFVIGQDEQTVKPIIERYLRDGVGPILYYALEEEKSGSTCVSNDLFYAENVQSFKEAIDITKNATGGSGFIAVKPTALCSPYLWKKMTEIILDTTIGVDSGLYHSRSVETVELGLSKHEVIEQKKMMQRAEEVIQYAADAGVKVMIDAEQTYFQPAIQRFLGVEMMHKFNKETVTVLVTYQTYLKGALDNTIRDLEYCKRSNFKFGARIVRGAYLDQERSLATQLQYEDPTNPTFEATTEMYHKTVEYLLESIQEKNDDMEVMFATHNEYTLRFILTLLSKESYSSDNICFGQIYGMCDHITFHLGQVGIPVYKSMPYGPIELVTSYLGRRAVENRGVLEKVQKERKLLGRELRRRIWKN